MSGKACRIFRLSSLAHTMKAFMGRLMCGSLLLRPRDSRNILESDTLGEPGGRGGGALKRLKIHLTRIQVESSCDDVIRSLTDLKKAKEFEFR